MGNEGILICTTRWTIWQFPTPGNNGDWIEKFPILR